MEHSKDIQSPPLIDNVHQYVDEVFSKTKKPDYFIGRHYSGTKFFLFFFKDYVVHLDESPLSSLKFYFPNEDTHKSYQVMVSPVYLDVKASFLDEQRFIISEISVSWKNRWGSSMEFICFLPDNPCQMIEKLAKMYDVDAIKKRNDEKLKADSKGDS
jgi:hypothetical protein